MRRIAGYNKQGVSLLVISETAEKIGFRTRGVKLTFEQLKEATLPAILHWNQNHFVGLISFAKNKIKVGGKILERLENNQIANRVVKKEFYDFSLFVYGKTKN